MRVFSRAVGHCKVYVKSTLKTKSFTLKSFRCTKELKNAYKDYP